MDFSDYCRSVDALLHAPWVDVLSGSVRGEAGWQQNRSLLVGVLPVVLASGWGIVDGLVLGALLSLVLLVVGVYVWARAAADVTAGMSAAVLCGAVGPLVLLSRTLSFYPELTAGLVFSGATAAAALRWRTPGAICWGGLGAGVAFLTDARGLIWGLTSVALCLLAVLGARRAHRLWAGLLLAATLVLSWGVGPWVYPRNTLSLEHQVDARRFFYDRGYREERFLPPFSADSAYVWGRSSPIEWPLTLQFLLEQATLAPPSVSAAPPSELKRTFTERTPAQVHRWVEVLGGAGVLSLVLGRGFWPRLALLLPTVPFLLSLRGATSMVEVAPRFLAAGLVPVAVFLGVSLSVTASRLPSLGLLSARWRPPLAAGACLLLVLGVVPSFLSPQAAWREPFPAEVPAEIREIRGDPRPVLLSPPAGRCVAVIRREAVRTASPPLGRLLPLGAEPHP